MCFYHHSLPKYQVFPKEPDSPPSAVESTEPSVQWCDFKSYCPDCSTCCKNKAGVWTCCVYTSGKCCADGIHCCAYGYSCDPTSTRCVVGDLSLPSFPQRPAVTANHTMPREIKEEKKHSDSEESTPAVPVQQVLDTIEMDDEIVHCDSSYGCPSDSTCCKRLNEGWGYCPYTEGQCCKDGKHCCESGYECDGSVSCRKGPLNIPAGLKNEPLTL
ncbi:granulins-like [Astyanax mexicanus]|uniref:Granulins-like n=1 Tax=Astyanax mexicanus TaxID=7994 RepID=A0A8T2LMR9_ASTMX|nr:granulins-like [Astyanax mexicanus]